MSPIPHPPAPSGALLTVYDEEYIITYLRMLDAKAERVRTGEKLHE
jgi:hypothetical protein